MRQSQFKTMVIGAANEWFLNGSLYLDTEVPMFYNPNGDVSKSYDNGCYPLLVMSASPHHSSSTSFAFALAFTSSFILILINYQTQFIKRKGTASVMSVASIDGIGFDVLLRDLLSQE
jgi:hypothetical protein